MRRLWFIRWWVRKETKIRLSIVIIKIRRKWITLILCKKLYYLFPRFLLFIIVLDFIETKEMMYWKDSNFKWPSNFAFIILNLLIAKIWVYNYNLSFALIFAQWIDQGKMIQWIFHTQWFLIWTLSLVFKYESSFKVLWIRQNILLL